MKISTATKLIEAASEANGQTQTFQQNFMADARQVAMGMFVMNQAGAFGFVIMGGTMHKAEFGGSGCDIATVIKQAARFVARNVEAAHLAATWR